MSEEIIQYTCQICGRPIKAKSGGYSGSFRVSEFEASFKFHED